MNTPKFSVAVLQSVTIKNVVILYLSDIMIYCLWAKSNFYYNSFILQSATFIFYLLKSVRKIQLSKMIKVRQMLFDIYFLITIK